MLSSGCVFVYKPPNQTNHQTTKPNGDIFHTTIYIPKAQTNQQQTKYQTIVFAINMEINTNYQRRTNRRREEGNDKRPAEKTQTKSTN